MTANRGQAAHLSGQMSGQMDRAGGSGVGVGGADGMPQQHQQMQDAVGVSGIDAQFVMLRNSMREKIFEYISRKQLTADWRRRLPELAKRLEKILFRKFSNKNDYYNMTRGPVEPQLQFAIKTLSVQNQQNQQNQQMSRQMASSSGYGTMIPTPGMTQGTSGNTRIPYVADSNALSSSDAGIVPQNANMGASMPVVNCNLDMKDNDDDLDEQNEAAETQVNIPQDAQGIILAFLPGRVVVRYRSVCKFWRDCIEEPNFVDCHLNNAFRFHQSIACFTSVDRGLVHMYTFDPTTMNFKNVELVFSNRFHISGPCNGLVCAYDFNGTAEVLNPTTRKHLRLPFSELKSQSLYSEYFVGFVHSTKEYKVVSVRHHVQLLTFEIYTIGALSWRIVRESAELLKASKAVIVNDGMYWLLLHEASSVLSREILMLNLTDEKFSKIAIPEAVKKRDLELFEGGGKLHLLSTPVYRNNNTMSDIWVSDWNRQVWVQLEIISPWVPVGMSPFFLCKMKFFFGNEDSLVCADLLDGTVSHINMPPDENLISCGMFVESFAPAVTGLVDSVASALSYGSRLTGLCLADHGSSSIGPQQSSDLTGWTASDLEQSLKRAKRTMNMEWKTSKHRGNSSLDLYSCLYGSSWFV